MKKILPFLFGILLLISYPVQALACSSFAVYRTDALYGMNFDFPDVPVRYSISQSGDMAVFHVDFETYGRYIPIAGMNEHGLFLAVQMLYPEELGDIESGSNKIELHTFARQALFNMKSVAEVKEQLEGQQLVNTFMTLHCMLADRNGEAIVLEPGKDDNRITKNPGDYLVMTNFSNADAFNPDTQKMEGVDCERYLTADAYIGQNQNSFTAENGLETLKRTIQTEGGYPTQTSTVYDPTNGEIFLTIHGDFERIWKVSLAEKTIESYRGFTQPVRLKLDEQGITAQELIDITNAPQTEPDAPDQESEDAADLSAALSPSVPAKQAFVFGPMAIAGLCLAVLCIVAVVWCVLSGRRRRR